ncbi:hypothetical protein Y032_0106g3748 [Ancylostoma ceylanicum]|uniref:Uncharacterized protein n=1 Tax=Ancylostoma ceylanicum TaxID=53326 RepID=A0A016TF53_9BILA|nr:hypothetical protein Y032_0106g3748 [Ancylostoma ceylanicum]
MTVTVHIIPKQQDDKLIRSVRSPFSVWDFDNSITLNMSTGPKLFNPYHYFGTPYMWARGFPVSRLQNHTNEHDELCLCHKMRSAAVQQGLVQKHLDVDVIFRLLHADKKNEEKFNEIAPPIVLQAGTYSPFNSRNTLFHRTAFFTLFLPITVTFEFPGDLYRKVDAMLEFLDGWECEHDEIAGCVVSLAEEFRERNFWGSADVEAIIQWISDLKKIGYQFPQRVDRDPYDISKNGTIRGQNCRRVSLKFGAFSKNSMTEKLLRKLNALGDIADWCAEANYTEHFPSIIRPFNYINLTEEEMQVGYYAYYCLAKVKEMKLGRVKGYFVMADDTTFNFWNGVNPELVMHPSGDTFHHSGVWWNRPSGFTAAVKTLELFEQTYKDDPSVQAIWRQYKKGLRKKNERRNASHVLIDRDGWSVADLYYIPSSGLDYFAGLMEIFFEAGLFHEIAFTKYLHSVPYESARFDYLNGTGGRGAWHERYNADLMMMHPIKLSFFGNLTERRRLCDSVLKTFSDKLLTTTTSDSNENSTE